MSESKFLAGQKILIAEDDENSFYLLEYILHDHDAQIIHAGNGEDAIHVLRDNPDVSLVLMDIRMPGMNGLESARKIREFNTRVPIIAQTAMLVEDDKEKVLEAGCNDIILKPIDKELILSKIKEHLHK